MSANGSASFVHSLRETEIVSTAQADEIARTLQPRFADARGLAQELVRRGCLTAFQADELLHDRGQGLVVGPYRLLDRLGEGGMGEVFKARHVRMDRVVALKLIQKDHLSEPHAIERFRREARAAAQLSHPNIVLAHDAGEAGDIHFLAMEYVEGVDLAKLVKQSGPLAIPLACDFIRQAALGLQHASGKGVVHRDIKPGNLLVTKTSDGVAVVKILDFGLARFESETGPKRNLTQIGKVVGTVDYISPEQAENARKADIRSDIYSLGCSLFYLLTGQAPFPGETAVERLSARLVGKPESVRALRREVPEGLEQILLKMLARDPANRFQTPAEVAAALEAFSKPGKVKARTADSVSGKPAARDEGSGTIEAVVKKRTQATGPNPFANLEEEDKTSTGLDKAKPTAFKAFNADRGPQSSSRKPAPRGRGWPVVVIFGLCMLLLLTCGVGIGIVALGPSELFARNAKDNDKPSDKEKPPDQDRKPADKGKSALGTAKPSDKDKPPGDGDKPSDKDRIVADKDKPSDKDKPPVAGKEPARLTAPFTAQQAKEAQVAWAKYLGRQIEEEIDLGNGVQLVVVLIPPGTFRMGSPITEPERNFSDKEVDAEKLHDVTITRPFYLGKYPVTQQQYEQVRGEHQNYCQVGGGGADKVKNLDTKQFPVDSVTWEDADKFCQTAGKMMILPSEAQWEYACRAGTTTPFWFGDVLNGDQCNCNGNAPYGTNTKGEFLDRPCSVGGDKIQYKPNAFGLYDMHGNVSQWCMDYYGPYDELNKDDPRATEQKYKNLRVLRGGSWYDNARFCRAACRFRDEPAFRSGGLGFRVCVRLD